MDPGKAREIDASITAHRSTLCPATTFHVRSLKAVERTHLVIDLQQLLDVEGEA